jgi:hypothetical protein
VSISISSRRRLVLLSCGAALAASACSGPPAHRPAGVVVTDSAGVTIVTSPAAMQAFEHWTLAPDPVVRIGSADGDPPYQLYQVMGAVRLSTGDVVVANGGTNELRWYDSDGTYRFTRGGTGDGPGRYRGLRTLLVLGGDSVLAGDLLLSSVHLYSPTGDLVRSWRVGELGRLVAPAPFARLADGTFVAMTEHRLSQPPGYVRSEMVVVRYRDGQVLDTVAVAPGGESYQSPCGPSHQAICNWSVPFGLRAHAVAQGTRIIVGNGDGYALRVFDPSGRLTAIYRRDVPREAVTSARLGRWVDSVAASASDQWRATARRALMEAPRPDSLPSFVSLMMDADGDTWVARPDTAGDGAAPWDVLGPDGAYLTTVEVPQGLRLTQIGDSFLVGIVRDANDVESVEVFRIAKGA